MNTEQRKPKSRRFRKVLTIALAGISVAAVIGASANVWLTKQERAKYPPPGEMIDIGGRSLHLYCTGERRPDQPTVLLETGAYGYSLNWFRIQPVLENSFRVCSYDRAGFGWSDSLTGRRSVMQEADDAIRMLKASEEQGPFILVGMSYGGVLVRQFFEEAPEMTAGIVFVDPASLEARRSVPTAFKIARQVAMAQRYGMAFLSNFGVWRAIEIPVSLPDDLDPALREQHLTITNWTRYHNTVADATVQMFRDMVETDLMIGQDFGDLPITILSANDKPGTERIIEKHRHHSGLASRSTNFRHHIIDGAAHGSFLRTKEYAATVIDAVIELDAVIASSASTE